MSLPTRLPALLASVARMRLPEWQLLARAWLAAPSVELALRGAGVKPTLSWLDRLPAHEGGGAAVSVEEATRLVRWACKLQPLVRGACLTRALTQYALHRRDGEAARFVIGVRKGGEAAANGGEVVSEGEAIGLDAHAWVQRPGAPSPEPAYTEILHREHGG